MSRFVTLSEAVQSTIRDGDSVPMEGFTHLIPFAAGHEVVRQRLRHLTLIRMTPDLIYEPTRSYQRCVRSTRGPRTHTARQLEETGNGRIARSLHL